MEAVAELAHQIRYLCFILPIIWSLSRNY